MMKMSSHLIHEVVAIRCKVRAKDALLVVVAMMANVAKRIVKRLMVLRLSSLMVSMRWPKPRVTRWLLIDAAMANDICSTNTLVANHDISE